MCFKQCIINTTFFSIHLIYFRSKLRVKKFKYFLKPRPHSSNFIHTLLYYNCSFIKQLLHSFDCMVQLKFPFVGNGWCCDFSGFSFHSVHFGFLVMFCFSSPAPGTTRTPCLIYRNQRISKT